MNVILKSMLVCGAAVAAMGSVARADVIVGGDLSTGWQGFMNVTDLPADGGGYEFGSGWGIADLQATFDTTGKILTLAPETSLDRDVPTDTYWWKDASGTSPGNKNMDASYYLESDALGGQIVTFTANVLSNTFAAPYTTVAFIKDFSPGYALNASTTIPLTPGVFSISLPTTAGDHIQYGFETIGPDARLADAAALGSAQVTAIPEPASFGLVGLFGLGALRRRR